MTRRIMAVGNGNELFEMVGGRVFRHTYDPQRGAYIPINEDFDGSPWANCRREGITVATALAGPLAALEQQNKAANAPRFDLETWRTSNEAAAWDKWYAEQCELGDDGEPLASEWGPWDDWHAERQELADYDASMDTASPRGQ
jgi:hypothetical protein